MQILTITPYELDEQVKSFENSLIEKGKKPEDLLKISCNNIANRLKNDPARYREYGAYWWAVKLILKEQGYDFGDANNPALAEQFGMKNPIRTLIAGELYKDAYCNFYLKGNTQFTLKDGAEYTLYDPDMESLILIN